MSEIDLDDVAGIAERVDHDKVEQLLTAFYAAAQQLEAGDEDRLYFAAKVIAGIAALSHAAGETTLVKDEVGLGYPVSAAWLVRCIGALMSGLYGLEMAELKASIDRQIGPRRPPEQEFDVDPGF